jgi:hypothetical protein
LAAGFAAVLRLETVAVFRGAIQPSLWVCRFLVARTIGKKYDHSNAIIAWLVFGTKLLINIQK